MPTLQSRILTHRDRPARSALDVPTLADGRAVTFGDGTTSPYVGQAKCWPHVDRTAVQEQRDEHVLTETIPEIEDATLVVAAQADRQAFASLYARYLSPVLRYCQARLSDPSEAEDAASQVFAKAMVGIGGCQPETFRSWLYTIARNVITDTYRRRAHRVTGPLEYADEIPDADPTPEERALVEEERQRLRALLDYVTPDQRRVVELRLAGLNGPEIAAALGISHGAVKIHQFRAIQRLRGVLTERGELDPTMLPGTTPGSSAGDHR